MRAGTCLLQQHYGMFWLRHSRGASEQRAKGLSNEQRGLYTLKPEVRMFKGARKAFVEAV